MWNILKQVAYEPNMCEVQNAVQPCEFDEQREIEETKLNEHSIIDYRFDTFRVAARNPRATGE